jgi:hypothetical protein
MKKSALIILLFLLAHLLEAGQTKYVIIAVIDGARYTETFGDPAHQYIPRIWSTLRPLGTIYTAFRNEGLTETNPGHASILTGTWQSIANDGTVRPHMPTLFEYFRKGTGAAANQNCVILGKTKLDILSYSDHPAYGSAYGGAVSYSASQYDDQIAMTNFRNAITTSHPQILIINLPKTDNAGHTGVWGSYLAGLQTADTLVQAMWTIVQNDPVMAGKTTMFITNDHGRHDDAHGGFTNHGDACEGCRHVMLLVLGPDTPVNTVDGSTRLQIDIAPTVGQLLGFATPNATGAVLTSAIKTDVAGMESSLPGSVELHQNYPNPFNPTSEIRYQVAGSGHVRLAVFDLLGREVALLVDEARAPGSYAVRFSGDGLSSGTYFYRLTAGENVRTRRMLLLR